jgi:SAM-dependent methyltransferase
MSNFYRAFEDRHRGSRELIKSRLNAYLPFLIPLTSATTPTALDLGCGRGEWLELLGETGFRARGVDLDEGMLAACRERGLDVATEDALASLRAQPDASLALVSAFHLVEHIPFESVQELIDEALRALQPGGLLIMETPNPENLVVATSSFYMDPSHLRPIPPQLLEFLVEFGGFVRQRIVRLQEPPQLHGDVPLQLMNVLNGVSPDYSVVAQKSAELSTTMPFDSVFAAPFGLDLATLAQRYQTQQDSRQGELHASLTQLTERVAAAEMNASGLFQRTLETISEAQASTRLMQAELHSARQRERTLEASVHAQALQEAEARAANYLSQAQEAGARAHHAEQRAVDAEQEAARARHEAAQQAERRATERVLQVEQQTTERAQRAQQQADEQAQRAEHLQWQLNEMTVRVMAAEQQVRDLHASTSWRVMGPARVAVSLLRRPLGAADVARMVAARNKARAGQLLMPLVRNLARRPAARAFAMRALARFPALEGRLRSLAYRALHGAPAYAPPTTPQAPALVAPSPGHAPAPLAPPPNMSRSAQNVFAQIQRSLHSDDHSET